MRKDNIILEIENCKVGIGAVSDLIDQWLPDDRIICITDANIRQLYPDFFEPFETITILPGEKHKTLDEIHELYMNFVENRVDRNCFVLGVGGGLVTDVSGFLATTFLRGINFGFVSTTLLGMVDAVVGGKNGVNFGKFKNMIGTINQPKFVICDPTFLSSLDEEEWKNGMSEAIKQLLITDAEGFEQVERMDLSVLQGNEGELFSFIRNQIEIKAYFVSQDENDRGIRRKLNFGHTFGHAIEALSGMRHGFAIAEGMNIAAKISNNMGYLSDNSLDRIGQILNRFELLNNVQYDDERLFDYIQKDKKRSGDSIHFVLLSGIGQAFLKHIPIKQLIEEYRKLDLDSYKGN